MRAKFISVYVLILSWAIYDYLVRFYGWNINLIVFYYSVFYLFILFWMYQMFKMTKKIYDSITLVILATPVFFRLLLTLFSIGKTKEGYNDLVNNVYLDKLTWSVLFIFLAVQSWKGLQRYQQR